MKLDDSIDHLPPFRNSVDRQINRLSDVKRHPKAAKKMAEKHVQGRKANYRLSEQTLSFSDFLAISVVHCRQALSLRFSISASKFDHTPLSPCQSPLVAALEYSVARASKKLACSTPFRIAVSHGIGCSSWP